VGEQRATIRQLKEKGREFLEETMIFPTTLRQREIEDSALRQTDHLPRVPGWSDLAKAMRYVLLYWGRLILHLDAPGKDRPRTRMPSGDRTMVHGGR
jgi:hypothetical protein